MRLHAVPVLCTFLLSVGCSEAETVPSELSSQEMSDQRYVLASYEMPSLTYEDAKTCYQIASISADEVMKTPGVVGQVLGKKIVPFWRYVVNVGKEGSAKSKDVLIHGSFVKSDLEPKFALMPGLVERSEQCGYVAGQSLTSAGFLNIGDIVEIEATDDNVSYDSQQSLGMYILGEASKVVLLQEPNMILDCVSTIRASIPGGDELSADYFVWVSALSDAVDDGDLESSTFSEVSPEFRNIFENRNTQNLAVEGLNEEVKQTCAKISTDEIARVSAEMSNE